MVKLKMCDCLTTASNIANLVMGGLATATFIIVLIQWQINKKSRFIEKIEKDIASIKDRIAILDFDTEKKSDDLIAELKLNKKQQELCRENHKNTMKPHKSLMYAEINRLNDLINKINIGEKIDYKKMYAEIKKDMKKLTEECNQLSLLYSSPKIGNNFVNENIKILNDNYINK